MLVKVLGVNLVLMINFTERLDLAIRKSARAHEIAGQHRKGGDIPYIIHPFSTMLIASNITDDEDTLIACLLHDVLEDVDKNIYNEHEIRNDFGDKVVKIVKDVSKNDKLKDWHVISQDYLNHLEFKACDEAIIVSASDKIHNIISVIIDYRKIGDKVWDIFKTTNKADQIWWYESILKIIINRNVNMILSDQLKSLIIELKDLTK